MVPFFSRRIGLDDSGVPQPVDYGAKLTGHAGAFDVGVLQVRTRDRGFAPGPGLHRHAIAAAILRQSYFGGLFTTRSDAAAAARQTAGVDCAVATAQSQQRGARGQWLLPQHNEAPGVARRRRLGARINMPNDPINWHVAVHQVQDGYDPAVGFVDRRAYRMIEPDLRYTVHTERGRYRRTRGSPSRGIQDVLQSRRAARTRRFDFQ